jgi:peptidoglycan/LPS O-acetylase OafA/YrhL
MLWDKLTVGGKTASDYVGARPNDQRRDSRIAAGAGSNSASVTAKSTATASTRLDFIDGLRGLAILLVILRHYYFAVNTGGWPRWADAMQLGYLGVHLFLILSGFCIAWAYVGPSARTFDWRDFFKRRAARILPAYYVALTISIILALPMPIDVLFWQTLSHITMTHNFFAKTVLALNSPFWSLALECQLYIVFPMLLFGYKKFGLALTLVLTFCIQMIYRFFIAWNFGTDYDLLTFVLPWSVAGRILEFGLGMWAACLIGRYSNTALSRAGQKLTWILSILFFIGAFVIRPKLGGTAPVTDLLWSLSFFCLLHAASVPGSILNRLCSWRPIVWLGVMSYSVYLVHEFFIEAFGHYIRENIANPAMTLGLLVPVGLITILLCSVFYRLVEKPAQVYFVQRHKRAPAKIATKLQSQEPDVAT